MQFSLRDFRHQRCKFDGLEESLSGKLNPRGNKMDKKFKIVSPEHRLKFPWATENLAARPGIVGIAGASILVTGCIFQLLGFEHAFSRAGCLLVFVAITLVYLNHFVSVAKEGRLSIVDVLERLGRNKDEIPLAIQRKFGKDAGQVHDDIVGAVGEARHDAKGYIKMSEKIVLSEFLVGGVGTLVWGFGNLLG